VCGALFWDDFSRTTGLGANWQVPYMGNWSTDGTYAIAGSPMPAQGDWASVVPSLGTSDYAVMAKLQLPSGSIDSGIFARGNPADVTGPVYAAQIWADGSVRLYHRDASYNWVQAAVSPVAAGIQPNTPYTLKLSVTGGSSVALQVWVDGVVKITATDPGSFPSCTDCPIQAGLPGMEAYTAPVKYDWFSVIVP
jgi:hypothetical protein